MAKLWYRYGAMGCSKTANALMVAFNYEEKGLKPLVLKPRLENRDGEKIIKSRIGLSRECGFVEDYLDGTLDEVLEKTKEYDCIIIDEVQFCTIEEIGVLHKIVDANNIPVICYGLRDDFLLNPFPASKELCAVADKIEELKTVCWCGQGATCNARIDADGNIVRKGDQIDLGGNDRYVSLCRKHYFSGQTRPEVK
ncbi:MAG: thymidine kinase [Lachnospiraceae bacterium]|nr:thymidine kinase [Lachnospiraceae bacterium]